MVNKSLIFSLVLAVGLLAICGTCFAQQNESVTITSYYPSPYGVYRTLRIYPSGGVCASGSSCAKEGEMCYNTSDHVLYVCSGTPATWRAAAGGGGSGWLLTGNAGTIAGTNFIGTTDAVDWVVKTANTEKMRVDTNGRVDIGGSPWAGLRVHSLGQGYIEITGASDEGHTYSALYFNDESYSDLTNSWFIAHKREAGTPWQDDLHIGYYVNPTTIIPAISIDSATGNVGIGNLTPAHPLHMGSGAHCSAAGVWINASSRVYKQDIAPLTLDNALKALMGLNPVTFKSKQAPDERHVGFIAEDVPELVASKDRTGLSPMDIVAVLTKVVQQQQREIEELKAKLNIGQ